MARARARARSSNGLAWPPRSTLVASIAPLLRRQAPRSLARPPTCTALAQGFKEGDTPNFTGSYYSHCKAITENLLHAFPNTLTLRVRMPIVEDLTYARNFIAKVQRSAISFATDTLFCSKVCGMCELHLAEERRRVAMYATLYV